MYVCVPFGCTYEVMVILCNPATGHPLVHLVGVPYVYGICMYIRMYVCMYVCTYIAVGVNMCVHVCVMYLCLLLRI